MYFMMTDRFCDEDSANNIPTGIDPTLYDPKQKDISLYYGTEFSLLDAGVKSVKMEELAA